MDQYYSSEDLCALKNGIEQEFINDFYQEYQCVNTGCQNKRLIHRQKILAWEDFPHKHNGYPINNASEPDQKSDQEFYPAMDFWICSAKCSEDIERKLKRN